MERERWKAALRGLLDRDKTVKLIVIAGLCGVLLIFLSPLFGEGREKAEQTQPEASDSGETAEKRLEGELVRVVRAITGEEAPTVLVTLESSRETVYAEDKSTGSRQSGEELEEEQDRTHVILKDSDGGQRGLAVTEIEPKIKGVVIVSRAAGDPAIRERLTEAVRTALGVSSARVCVTEAGGSKW